MTTRRWAIAAGMAVTAAGLSAQSGGGFGGGGGRGAAGGMEFQQATSMSATPARKLADTGPLAVIGRPFSATEERKSIQKLGDGTEISSSETNLLYRDSQGRTRVEQIWQGKKVIGILDPVSMSFMTVNEDNKTVSRTSIPDGTTRGSLSIAGGALSRQFGSGNGGTSYWVTGVNIGASAGAGAVASGPASAVALPRTTAPPVAVAGGRGGGGGGAVGGVLTRAPMASPAKDEELGVQTTNGVLAVGKRSTVTIPQGQIGNNRDIHIINERWFSEDLQMTVKTVNSDPRFGDNIYEMTSISRNEPDPTLFQIPAGYSVVDAPNGGMFRVAVPTIKQ